MTIQLVQPSNDAGSKFPRPGNPDRFIHPMWVRAELPESRVLYTLQGIAVVNFKSDAQSTWKRDELNLKLYLEERPKWRQRPNPNEWEECELEVEHFSGSMHLNSIYNEETAIYAGWAIDDVYFPRWPTTTRGYFDINARIAGRDRDSYIYRIGYNITLYGRYGWKLYNDMN